MSGESPKKHKMSEGPKKAIVASAPRGWQHQDRHAKEDVRQAPRMSGPITHTVTSERPRRAIQ